MIANAEYVHWNATTWIGLERRDVRCIGHRRPVPSGRWRYGFAMVDRETGEDVTSEATWSQSTLSTAIDLLLAARGA